MTGSGSENTVQIGTEAQEEGQLNVNRQDMMDVLYATFGQPGSGKLDFNNAGHDALVNRLRQPLAEHGVPLTDQQLQDLVTALLSARDTQHSGLITDFGQLSWRQARAGR